MGKKAGVVPQMNNAVGQASLGRIPGSSFQPPGTPDRILGKNTANSVAEGVGALGTGTAGLYGPSPTQAALSSGTGAGSTGVPQARMPMTQYGGGADGGRSMDMKAMYAGGPSGRSPMDSLTMRSASPQGGLPGLGGQIAGMRPGGKSSAPPPDYTGLTAANTARMAGQPGAMTQNPFRPGGKAPVNVPGYGTQPVNPQALTTQMRAPAGQMTR